MLPALAQTQAVSGTVTDPKGEATALLAGRGANVVLGARDEEKLKALAGRIASAGGEAAYAAIDVRQRADLVRLVQRAQARYGQLDVLVSNAGVMPIGPLDELAVEDWEQMIDVNLKGVLSGIAAALPVFRRQAFGHFVNIASTATQKVVANQAVYAGTKAAVRAISEGLRQEVGDKQLRVTIISPGFTATSFTNGVKNPEIKAQLEKSRDKFAMFPDAIAQAIAYALEQPADVEVGEVVIQSTARP